MRQIRDYLACFYVTLQDPIVHLLTKNKSSHKILFTPGIEPYRWTVGQWRALRTFHKASKRVPAYKKHVAKTRSGQPKITMRGVDFSAVVPMDKQSYIKPYSAEERCWNGVLPTRGVLVDESSGSSGHPTSWVRGKNERTLVKSIIQVAFSELTQNKPVFIINAFAMGAWATGMATTMALVDDYIIKATGPDKQKIIETLSDFGPNYDYVILGYPPFLKDLADEETINLKQYDILAIYGGEAMSESLRNYLLQTYQHVVGSYGASDLEINIASETDFTIALRKACIENEELKNALTKTSYGVLPMMFQYNPFDYLLETNEHNELLISICRETNINPRLRYNIHDIGHVTRMKHLRPTLKAHGYEHLLSTAKTDLPVLFYYGRSDLSLDFYGAVISPESIRQVVFADKILADVCNTFRLIAFEDKHAKKHLLFAIEMDENAEENTKQLETNAHKQIIDYLLANNLDFKQALSVAETSNCNPTTRMYKYDHGPFKRVGKQKLKDEYIWNLSYEQAKEYKLIKDTHAVY